MEITQQMYHICYQLCEKNVVHNIVFYACAAGAYWPRPVVVGLLRRRWLDNRLSRTKRIIAHAKHINTTTTATITRMVIN